MNKINIDKVKQIVAMVLGEQGKTLYVSPVIYSLALLFVFAFMDNNYSDMVEDTIMFSIPMSMIIPILLIIQKFLSESQVQRTTTLPGSNIDKYMAMVVAEFIQSVFWFILMFAADVVFLLISCSIIYGTDTSSVLTIIFDTKYLRHIVPMMYMSSLVGWWKIASRTPLSSRLADYMLIVCTFVVYLIMFPMLSGQGETMVILGLNIYSLLIIILAIVRSYYNFKKIISYLNK